MAKLFRTQTSEIESDLRKLSIDSQRSAEASNTVLGKWQVPESARVSLREIPEILVSMFGRYRRDAVTDPSDDDFAYEDANGIGEARLFYSSRVEAPFELFALRWNGENLDPEAVPSTTSKSTGDLPDMSPQSSSGRSASPATASSEPVVGGAVRDSEPPEKHRSRAKSISHSVAKHILPGHHESSASSAPPASEPKQQHTPTAFTFSKLIKLPSDTSLRSVTPDDWDPKQEYMHIIVNISAATGSPAKIYEATASNGIAYYWIVGKVAGSDVLVGVSTYAQFSTADDTDDAPEDAPAKPPVEKSTEDSDKTNT